MQVGQGCILGNEITYANPTSPAEVDRRSSGIKVRKHISRRSLGVFKARGNPLRRCAFCRRRRGTNTEAHAHKASEDGNLVVRILPRLGSGLTTRAGSTDPGNFSFPGLSLSCNPDERAQIAWIRERSRRDLHRACGGIFSTETVSSTEHTT